MCSTNSSGKGYSGAEIVSLGCMKLVGNGCKCLYDVGKIWNKDIVIYLDDDIVQQEPSLHSAITASPNVPSDTNRASVTLQEIEYIFYQCLSYCSLQFVICTMK